MQPARKNGCRLSILALVSIIVVVAPSHAQTINDPPDTPEEVASRRHSLSLLRQGRFEELDGKMNGLQRSYELGRLRDESLLHQFRAFYDTAPALEGQYNAWIAKLPRSYSAYLARGIYYRYRGTEARGTRYVSETPREQLDVMSMYLDKAMPDYEQSLTLTQKPLLTYHSILAVTMLTGDTDVARRMLDESVRIDPRNFVVRYKFFNTLQTRWGGSLAQMLDFLQTARAAGLSDAQLKYFENMIAVERRWLNARRQ